MSMLLTFPLESFTIIAPNAIMPIKIINIFKQKQAVKTFRKYIVEDFQEKIDACTFLHIDAKDVVDAQLYSLGKDKYETNIKFDLPFPYESYIHAFFIGKTTNTGAEAKPDKTQNPSICYIYYYKNRNEPICRFPVKKLKQMKKIVTDYYAKFNADFEKLFDEIKDNYPFMPKDLSKVIKNNVNYRNNWKEVWKKDELNLIYTGTSYDGILLPTLRWAVDMNDMAHIENYRPMFADEKFDKQELHFYTESKRFLAAIDKLNTILKNSIGL